MRLGFFHCCLSRLFHICLIMAVLFCTTPASAQQGAYGTAATLGGACSATYFVWPDVNGRAAQCVGGFWTEVPGGMVLISTQTASASASLQFTSLPTTYTTLFLNCAGILLSANNILFIMQVGEGAGPTWETTANYNMDAEGYSSFHTTTSTDLLDGLYHGSTTNPASIKGYIDNVGSSSIYKNMSMTATIYDGVGYLLHENWGGYWSSDTNPITAIRLTVSSGTISSGTCSLYGMN